jgi:hypothetical protein
MQYIDNCSAGMKRITAKVRKGKSIPVTGLRGLEGCERSRFIF